MKLLSSALSRGLFSAVLASSALACHSYHPLTPGEVAQRGTRTYPHVTRAHATEATEAALSTLGYQVTVSDVNAGVVKTAPKTVSVSAVGGYGYASAIEDGLAWSVSVDQSGADAVVHLAPRGFRNGSEMRDANIWTAEALDSKLADVWRELDGDIRVPSKLAVIGAFAR